MFSFDEQRLKSFMTTKWLRLKLAGLRLRHTLSKLPFTRILSIVIASCFIYSFVLFEPLMGAVSLAREQRAAGEVKERIERFTLPYRYGRVVSGALKSDSRLVVYIQDLHCHSEVQKNIYEIIKLFDNRYGVEHIYVEGAPAGHVDTVLSVLPSELKDGVLDELMGKGLISGGEYYAAKEGKETLYGLENWGVYVDNVARIQRLLADKEYNSAAAKELSGKIEAAKARYLSKAIKKLDGKLAGNKDYEKLAALGAKVKEDISQYPNLERYVRLSVLKDDISFKRLPKEISEYIGELKKVVPFSVYQVLIKRLEEGGREDEYYRGLYEVARQYTPRYGEKYPQLEKFLEYVRLNYLVNPIGLVAEERGFIRRILEKEARSNSDRELLFISRMGEIVKDVAELKVTPEDYEYYKENAGRFKLVVQKYVDYSDAAAAFELLSNEDITKYFETNIERNDIFVKNLSASSSPTPPAPATENGGYPAVIDNLSEFSAIDIVITGGFHCGVADMLANRNVSYLSITPNVTSEFDGTLYEKLMTGTLSADISKSALATPVAQWAGLNVEGDNAISAIGEDNFELLVGAMLRVAGGTKYNLSDIPQDLRERLGITAIREAGENKWQLTRTDSKGESTLTVEVRGKEVITVNSRDGAKKTGARNLLPSGRIEILNLLPLPIVGIVTGILFFSFDLPRDSMPVFAWRIISLGALGVLAYSIWDNLKDLLKAKPAPADNIEPARKHPKIDKYVSIILPIITATILYASNGFAAPLPAAMAPDALPLFSSIPWHTAGDIAFYIVNAIAMALPAILVARSMMNAALSIHPQLEPPAGMPHPALSYNPTGKNKQNYEDSTELQDQWANLGMQCETHVMVLHDLSNIIQVLASLQLKNEPDDAAQKQYKPISSLFNSYRELIGKAVKLYDSCNSMGINDTKKVAGVIENIKVMDADKLSRIIEYTNMVEVAGFAMLNVLAQRDGFPEGWLDIGNVLKTLGVNGKDELVERIAKIRDSTDELYFIILKRKIDELTGMTNDIEEKKNLLNNKARELLSVAGDDVRRDTINDLIELTASEALPDERLDIADVFQWVSERERKYAHIDFKNNISGNDVGIMGRKYRLKDVTGNLVKNSVEAKSRINKEEVPDIVITLGDIDGFYVVEYKDDGPGIPEELLESRRLFDKGVTTKTSGDKRFHGFGMAICENIIEEMGGYIVPGNRDDGVMGAKFTMYLPKYREGVALNDGNLPAQAAQVDKPAGLKATFEFIIENAVGIGAIEDVAAKAAVEAAEPQTPENMDLMVITPGSRDEAVKLLNERTKDEIPFVTLSLPADKDSLARMYELGRILVNLEVDRAPVIFEVRCVQDIYTGNIELFVVPVISAIENQSAATIVEKFSRELENGKYSPEVEAMLRPVAYAIARDLQPGEKTPLSESFRALKNGRILTIGMAPTRPFLSYMALPSEDMPDVIVRDWQTGEIIAAPGHEPPRRDPDYKMGGSGDYTDDGSGGRNYDDTAVGITVADIASFNGDQPLGVVTDIVPFARFLDGQSKNRLAVRLPSLADAAAGINFNEALKNKAVATGVADSLQAKINTLSGQDISSVDDLKRTQAALEEVAMELAGSVKRESEAPEDYLHGLLHEQIRDTLAAVKKELKDFNVVFALGDAISADTSMWQKQVREIGILIRDDASNAQCDISGLSLQDAVNFLEMVRKMINNDMNLEMVCPVDENFVNEVKRRIGPACGIVMRPQNELERRLAIRLGATIEEDAVKLQKDGVTKLLQEGASGVDFVFGGVSDAGAFVRLPQAVDNSGGFGFNWLFGMIDELQRAGKMANMSAPNWENKGVTAGRRLYDDMDLENEEAQFDFAEALLAAVAVEGSDVKQPAAWAVIDILTEAAHSNDPDDFEKAIDQAKEIIESMNLLESPKTEFKRYINWAERQFKSSRVGTLELNRIAGIFKGMLLAFIEFRLSQYNVDEKRDNAAMLLLELSRHISFSGGLAKMGEMKPEAMFEALPALMWMLPSHKEALAKDAADKLQNKGIDDSESWLLLADALYKGGCGRSDFKHVSIKLIDLCPLIVELGNCSDQELVYWYNFLLIADRKKLHIAELPDFRLELENRIKENPAVKDEIVVPAVYLSLMEILDAESITEFLGSPTRQDAMFGNNRKENGETARDAIAVRAIFGQMRPEANDGAAAVLERNAELARRRAFSGDTMSVAVAFRLIIETLKFGNMPVNINDVKGMMNIQIDKTLKPLLCAG